MLQVEARGFFYCWLERGLPRNQNTPCQSRPRHVKVKWKVPVEESRVDDEFPSAARLIPQTKFFKPASDLGSG